LQSLAPTNPLWALAVGYVPFSLCVIHKEGLCPSSGALIGWTPHECIQYKQQSNAYLSLRNQHSK
jgi:hypothetical protein